MRDIKAIMRVRLDGPGVRRGYPLMEDSREGYNYITSC